MSITSEINRLQTAKADLKTAIEDKGVTVPSSTKLDGYADLVDSIEAGGGSSSDEWLYYNMPGVLIYNNRMDFYLSCSNSSNITVERISSEGSFSSHYNSWYSDWHISDEPIRDQCDVYFRIKPKNMSVGDTGTLSIGTPSDTTTITFKLIETFSNNQLYYQGADIQKLIINNINFIGGGASD